MSLRVLYETHASAHSARRAELDRLAGPRRRSAFIAELIRRGIDDERRWEEILGALGQIPDTGHEWDEDPAAWVRRQRHADDRRTG